MPTEWYPIDMYSEFNVCSARVSEYRLTTRAHNDSLHTSTTECKIGCPSFRWSFPPSFNSAARFTIQGRPCTRLTRGTHPSREYRCVLVAISSEQHCRRRTQNLPLLTCQVTTRRLQKASARSFYFRRDKNSQGLPTRGARQCV